MTTILVTGGAGYIGSGTAQQLIKEGYDVVIIDNLSKGKRECIPQEAVFYEMDLTDDKALEHVFDTHTISTVIHFASYKAVGESMENAVKYSDNIIGSLHLLNAMIKHGTRHIIFSSTAAVYQEQDNTPIDEQTPIKPLNYYGATKHLIEENIKWYSKIHSITYTILRYFNVAGDSKTGYVDPNAQNIFPIITDVLEGKRKEVTIFGNDYNTRDGTGVRDYIDVNDLIKAHIKAIKQDESHIINLGTGKGYSVLELIKAFENVTGKHIPRTIGPRRKGDPAVVIASNDKAKNTLNWTPTTPIEETVQATIKANHSRSR
ncbi:MAG: UDP-glucose 4-epimerase GalE [Nanobdellota archaeon]